ncbi:hypothetical protein [Nonomuraea endophytica]|uniref:DUF3011 domain-containing protein n=1 Tax=Nonomuraea endophytica TaxID=714136 RepID=A0A7W7ZYW3_9ACTN|nr:hypothetical protein [Nonomuraea endophytica]MBB5075393.1 hypothetical protein [Nonomuraea endophytica]
MRIKRLAVTTAICAMAAFTAGSTPAWAEPPSEATNSALARWDCDGKRVIPESKSAALGCIRSGSADNNWSRGVWDCDWQTDIWTSKQYQTWALTQTCANTLVGWDFVYGWG